MRRAVILATLTLLLLAVAGITMARESTVGPERSSQTELTGQEPATTTGEPIATTREPTDIADEGSTEKSEPAAGSVTEESTGPEIDEPGVTKEQAPGGNGEHIGKPEGVGK